MASEGDRRTTNRLLSGPNIPLGWCGAISGAHLCQYTFGTDPDVGI